jgi:putative redox protein
VRHAPILPRRCAVAIGNEPPDVCGFPVGLFRARAVAVATDLRDAWGMSTEVAETGGLRASARSTSGSLRQVVVIDDGRHVLFTDEPERLGGEDSGPAPHELFPAALASCVATTIQMYARARNWDIGEVRVEVDYDHRSTPRRFTVVLHLDRSLSRERVERLTKVAAGCPVRRAIESGIVFDEQIVLDGARRATAFAPS